MMTRNFRFQGAVTIILAITMVLPFGFILWGAIANLSWLGVSTESWAGHTTVGLLRDFWSLYCNSFYFSLELAFACVLVALPVGLFAGLGLTKLNAKIQSRFESLFLLPLSTPGVIVALAMIQALAFARGSAAIILAGHLVYTVPFVIRLTLDAIRATSFERLLAAARLLGAERAQRFWWVMLPMLRPTLVTAALLTFAVSWGEFNVSFILNTPVNQTLPAALYATFTGNSFRYANLAATIFLAVLVPVLWLLQMLGCGRWVGQRTWIAG